VNQTSANDPDQNDILNCWSWLVAKAMGAEFGIVAFGGSGLTVIGEGNVPVLATSYNLIMAGVTRSFTPTPDMIILNEGSNDGSALAATVQAALVTVLNDLLGATPSTTKIVVLQTFGNYQTAALQAAITQVNNSRVYWIPTTGFFNTTYGEDSTGYHPTGANDLAMIGPQVANAVIPLLYTSTTTGRSYIFS
jgi:lysophospholipase L1-like esterase